MVVLSISKSLNRVEQIHIVWPSIVPTLGFHCSRDWLCGFCVFG